MKKEEEDNNNRFLINKSKESLGDGQEANFQTEWSLNCQ